MSSTSSHKAYNKAMNDFSVAVSMSSLVALLAVGGFCWFFYYMCRPMQPKVRKPSMAEVIASGGVPGDPHGRWEHGRSHHPDVYIDRIPAPIHGIQSPNLLCPAGLDLRRGSYGGGSVHSTDELLPDPPPSYPGLGNPGLLSQVTSRPHSPAESPLPPPYINQ